MPETSAEKARDYEPDFRGPVKSRSCTDVLCLFLFLAFLVGWGVVGYFAFVLGNPDRLVHPTDSNGRVCGFTPEVRDKPFLFFFDLTRCAHPSVLATGCPTPQVCVSNCPNETFVVTPTAAKSSLVKEKLICKENVTVTSSNVMDLILRGDCAAWYIKSTPVAGRCVPLVDGDDLNEILVNGGNLVVPGQDVTIRDLVQGSQLMAKLVNARQVVEGIFQDFRTTWWLILIGLAVAMVVSLMWIVLMRWVAAIMVWLSIFVVLVLQGFGIYYCYIRYEDLKNVEGANKSLTEIAFTTNLDTYLALRDTWLVFLIILAVTLGLLIILLIFLRKRISIAIALIAHASKAVGSIMSTLFFPIIPWIIQVAVIGYFIAVALYLASVGTATFKVVGMSNRTDDCTCPPFQDGYLCTPETFSVLCKCKEASCQFFEYGGDSRNITYLQIYNLFAVFWGLFFITAFGEMVLAGAFASWYWAFDKSRDVPTFPLAQSFVRTIRYHLGTVAFGSLIISIIRMIRVLLEYVDRKLKEYKENVVVKVIMCCCKCCFWCLEKFMKFVNRNAYIMTAIYGTNFCISARNAFFLLLRNVARVVVLDKVTDFLLFLGRMVVVGGIGVASFIVFSGRFAAVSEHIPTLNYYLVPVITTTLGSYFIASLFFNVYAMAVDTLFLCFLEDCERHDGSPEKPYFMSKGLMEILGKKNNF